MPTHHADRLIGSKNIARACPNTDAEAHTSSKASTERLDAAQVRAALGELHIGRGSALMRYARYRAWTADLDADDLMQEAILRALSSRTCPSHISIEHFLMGVMRSIASAAIKRRERDVDTLLGYGLNAAEGPAPADQAICATERATVCRNAIERVIADDPLVEAVLDGIDEGLCGASLAWRARTDKATLATVRRLIKRRVASEWGALLDLDEAA
ncbi:hypothetical protein AAG594_09010 [Citromicrobium bathyomarinum]